VVGLPAPNGRRIGTVDKIEGGRIKLTKKGQRRGLASNDRTIFAKQNEEGFNDVGAFREPTLCRSPKASNLIVAASASLSENPLPLNKQ
jgi:hypothetical protein